MPAHRSGRLLVFLAAVFLVKLIVVLQLHDHPLLQPDAGLDTSAYVALASRVRGGDLLLGPGLYFVSPLYIYFLAAALALFNSFTAVRVVQIALGTAGVACVFVATRAWFGERAAWIAAGAATLTGIFTFYEALLLQSALDPFLTAAALAALAIAFRPRDDPRRNGDQHRTRSARSRPADGQRLRGEAAGGAGAVALAGCVLGIQTLNRPNVLLPALAIGGLLVAIRHFRAALLFVGGLAIALAPMLARNVIVAGTWSPLPSHGGLNLYIGNNPEADGTYHSVAGITPDIAGQAGDVQRVAARALGHPVTDAQASAYFTGLALDWVRSRPAAAARLFLKKLAYTFNGAHIPLNDSYPFYAYDVRTLLMVLPAGAWVLVPLGLFGLIAAAPRERLRSYLVWVSFVPAYAVSVAIFFASDRYRVPLLVPLCIGTGAAIDRMLGWRPPALIVRRADTRRAQGRDEKGSAPRSFFPAASARSAMSLLTVAALLVFANWPLGLDDGRIEERTRMAETLATEGRADEATAWALRAEEHNPQPALVEFRVGRALLAAHDAAGAVRHLDRALALDPGRGETEYALGQALLDANRPHDAVPHLRAAVGRGVRADVAGFDLARALASIGDRAGAVEALGRVSPSSPHDAASWLALGDLAVRLGAVQLEEKFFRGAAFADPTDATARLNLAVAEAQQGRIADARRDAEQALKLRPDYERARMLIAALEGR